VFRASRIALTAAFVALAVTLGYLLATIPNVELVTLTVFLGGAATGGATGLMIGAIAGGLHSVLNPLGMPMPYVLVAQIVGWALVGATGGLLGPRLGRLLPAWRVIALGACGLLLTFVYQVLVNAAFGLHFGPVLPAVKAGLAFTVLHLVANTVAFATLGVGGLRVIGELDPLGRGR
jgi:hypothetical protein